MLQDCTHQRLLHTASFLKVSYSVPCAWVHQPLDEGEKDVEPADFGKSVVTTNTLLKVEVIYVKCSAISAEIFSMLLDRATALVLLSLHTCGASLVL